MGVMVEIIPIKREWWARKWHFITNYDGISTAENDFRI